MSTGLNPCFNGIWSASSSISLLPCGDEAVLILVLMEYGLRASSALHAAGDPQWGLNPCFNGIWSASFPMQYRKALDSEMS